MYRALPTLDWLFLFLVQLLTLKHCCGNTQTLCHHLKKKRGIHASSLLFCTQPQIDRCSLLLFLLLDSQGSVRTHAKLYCFFSCFVVAPFFSPLRICSCFNSLMFPMLVSFLSIVVIDFSIVFTFHRLALMFSFFVSCLTSLIKRLLLFGLNKKTKFSCQPVCFICQDFFGCPDSTLDTHNPI